LCAHWDTRPWSDSDTIRKGEPNDGASDGASGVGVLLEVARQLKQSKSAIGIDIIMLDMEDYGQPSDSPFQKQEDTYGLGTQYWAKNLHVPNYNAEYGILLDMVGAKNAVFAQEGYSLHFAPSVVQKVWNTANQIGFSDYFPVRDGEYLKGGYVTDDHYYVNTLANIPCIDIIQSDLTTKSGFGSYHHTHADNMDIIDKNTLKAVGQTLLQVIYSE
jgi:Zn-dependent M28 family amino/carboxypeptidase